MNRTYVWYWVAPLLQAMVRGYLFRHVNPLGRYFTTHLPIYMKSWKSCKAMEDTAQSTFCDRMPEIRRRTNVGNNNQDTGIHNMILVTDRALVRHAAVSQQIQIQGLSKTLVVEHPEYLQAVLGTMYGVAKQHKGLPHFDLNLAERIHW